MLGRRFYVFLSRRVFQTAEPLTSCLSQSITPNKEPTMNRMNRREFLSVLGGASAISLAVPAFASSSATDKDSAGITSLYVKGLVMVDLGDPQVVRLGFPKAPGHKATLSIIPQNGIKKYLVIKGKDAVERAGVAS